MRAQLVLMTLVLLTGFLRASEVKAGSPVEALETQIEGLKPREHLWRKIAWVRCPLEALKQSREKKRPILVWSFLGYPSEERC